MIFAALLFWSSVAALYAVPVHADFRESMNSQLGAFTGRGGANFSAAEDPRVIAARIIKVMLTFIGTAFLAFMVYAGYLIMLSGGDEEKITKGKSTLKTCVLGIIITLSAYTITVFISSALTVANRTPDAFEAGYDVYINQNNEALQQRYQNTDPLNPPPTPFTPGALNQQGSAGIR